MRPVAEKSPEPRRLSPVRRKGVAGSSREQVLRVACPLAEPVRLLEGVGVTGVEQAEGAELVQCLDRRRDPDLGMARAVLELEELHRELHVG